MSEQSWLPVAFVLFAAFIGAATDVWKFRVYNVLTLPLVATGLLYHGIFGGAEGLSTSFLGMLFGFGVLIVPYLLGLMGAGDVKLLAGVGAWLGYPMTLVVFTVTALVTGVYAAILIVIRGKISESWATIKVIFYRFLLMGKHFGKEDLVEPLSVGADRRLRVIPFGAMIPLGISGALVWFRCFT